MFMFIFMCSLCALSHQTLAPAMCIQEPTQTLLEMNKAEDHWNITTSSSVKKDIVKP